MKKLIPAILLFALSLNVFSETPEKQTRAEMQAQLLAEQIYQTYSGFRTDNIEISKEISHSLGLELTKEVSYKIQKGCMIDSLVLANDEEQRWMTYKATDIQYVKNIEVMFVMKSDEAYSIATHLRQILAQKGKHLVKDDHQETVFKDNTGCVLIDDRFKEVTKTEVYSLYNYEIKVLDEYLMIDFKETLPRKFEPSKRQLVFVD
ncbi:MAG: hypothetical protein KI791_13485 [Cyclobacteriaceae bacterium]|nr:hypothetical protein [Cyclobacteriaceae bacterium SS2]